VQLSERACGVAIYQLYCKKLLLRDHPNIAVEAHFVVMIDKPDKAIVACWNSWWRRAVGSAKAKVSKTERIFLYRNVQLRIIKDSTE